MSCLLFSSDGETAESILQVLTGLGVEGDLCRELAAAVEKVTQGNFQIVIIDWDQQPEAAQLLAKARERKASERPLTLAIVSDDVSVPKALQAGANSILRKPLVGNQVGDTLTTARDLLRAKQESAATAAQAAAAGASAAGAPAGSVSTLPANLAQGNERNLRAGEFLHSAPSAPGGQFVTDSEVHEFKVSSSVEKDLEPVAASVEEVVAPPPPPPPETGETRGLEWYLKTRGGTGPQGSAGAAAAPAPAPAKPELLGFDQTPAYSPASSEGSAGEFASEAKPDSQEIPGQGQEHSQQQHEEKKEAELFSYITGGSEPEKVRRAPLRLGKGAIIGALALAACAVVAAPQAPWHAGVRAAWARGGQTVHAWLNPQLVTTPQAPIAHEDFGRAGDEYKLPVAENIPDATTDPSQIHVIPVVDPTVKKPNNMGENAEPALQGDPAGATPADPTAAPGVPAPANPGAPTTPETAQPAGGPAAGANSASPNSGTPGSTPASGNPATLTPAASAPTGSTVVAPSVTAPRSDTPVAVAPASTSVPAALTAVSKPPHTVSDPTNVPSSLKSQMASMTPDAGGNKPPEAAMQAIEPVKVPEAAERALLTDQPAPDYPGNSNGQPGTVTLQVLIGRDGTVEDAKFLQGSLAFARVAIDGVKRWKFKPYIMNGRPVSVQTPLTISFKPAQ